MHTEEPKSTTTVRLIRRATTSHRAARRHKLTIDTGADQTIKNKKASAIFQPTGGTTTVCGATESGGETAAIGTTSIELQSTCGAWLLVQFQGTAEARLAHDADELLLSIGQYHDDADLRTRDLELTLGQRTFAVNAARQRNGTRAYTIPYRDPSESRMRRPPDVIMKADDVRRLRAMTTRSRSSSRTRAADTDDDEEQHRRRRDTTTTTRSQTQLETITEETTEPAVALVDVDKKASKMPKRAGSRRVPPSTARRRRRDEPREESDAEKAVRAETLERALLRMEEPQSASKQRTDTKPSLYGKRCKLVHRAAAHISMREAQRVLSRSDLLARRHGTPTMRAEPEHHCHECHRSKQHSARRSGKAARDREKNQVLCGDILYFKAKAADGTRGYLMLIDRATKLAAALPLKTKTSHEVRSVFEQYCKMRDISLRGLEFQFDSDSAVAKADDFVAWLRTSGASPRYSAPGDNYQNGAAERLVRTLKERAKALMKERGAPMTAHAWAMRHAVLLYNNTPTRSLRDNDAEYPFDLRTPAEAHGIETIDIARLPVLFSGADVYVQQMQRAAGARAKDTDDVQRERWWADNTQSMIFVGVSPMHADNVFQFVPTFSSTTTSLRTSRTYRVDNRRYKTADWIANAKLAPDGIKAMRHSRAAIRPAATSGSDADETDVDASDLDSDSLSDDECDDWLDECAASAEEDDDMPGLYWVKLPRRMHVSDMADLFDCDESDLMHFMRCFKPFSGTSSRAIVTTERPIYDARMRVPHPRLSGTWWTLAQHYEDQDDALEAMNNAADECKREQQDTTRVRRVQRKMKARTRRGNNRLPDPPSCRDALSGVHGTQFAEARVAELEQLMSFRGWSVVRTDDVPDGEEVLPTKWAYKYKWARDGTIRRFKARLCAVGTRHVAGIDFGHSTAPTISSAHLRFMLARAARHRHAAEGLDFTSAFNQCKLKKPVWLRMPSGFQQDGCVIRCSSSQYGLRVSPRLFHEHATKLFKALGFRVCPSDHCMFHRPADGVLIGIHVDDCVITAPTRGAIRAFKDELRARDVAFTDDQDLSDILGIEIEHGADGSISIGQRTYIDNMVKAFDFEYLPAAPTPWIKRRKPPDKLPKAGPTLQLLGKLTWLAMQTRPDIAWPVNKCAQMSADPTRANEMWERMVRIVAYVKQTRDRRLTFTAGDNRGWPTLAVFADADFAGCLETRRSTTGVVTARGHWDSHATTEPQCATPRFAVALRPRRDCFSDDTG